MPKRRALGGQAPFRHGSGLRSRVARCRAGRCGQRRHGEALKPRLRRDAATATARQNLTGARARPGPTGYAAHGGAHLTTSATPRQLYEDSVNFIFS